MIWICFGLVWICEVCILNKCYANGVHVIYIYEYWFDMRTSYVMSSFPRFFVSLFLFSVVSLFPRFFVSSFLRFLVSSFPSFLRFFVSSFLRFPRFFVSSFLRFFVSLFPRFFISSFLRFLVPTGEGPRLKEQFPCVFSWFWNIFFLILLIFIFLILLIFFFDPLNIFFWYPSPPF